MEESFTTKKALYDLLDMYINEMDAEEIPKNKWLHKPNEEQRLKRFMTHSDLTKTTKWLSMGLNECRNSFEEEKKVSYNDNVSETDVKVEICKKNMKSLLRSFDSEDEHSCGPHHNHVFTNTQKNSVGVKTKFSIRENILEEPYLKEGHKCNNLSHCADKTTYCRPVINIYSQEIINKAKKRNEKLLLLVKKLLQAREQGKRNEAWNNYINEIKNKHRFCNLPSNKISESLATEDESPIIIDEFYKSTNPDYMRKSNLCEDLLREFFKTPSVESLHEPGTSKSYSYRKNSFCFPNFSQDVLVQSNRKLIHGHSRHLLPTKKTREKSTLVEKKVLKINQSSQTLDQEADKFKCIPKLHKGNRYCCQGSQISDEDKCISVPEDLENNNNNKLKQFQNETNQTSLSNILVENKLDFLIHSLNSFLEELKSNKIFMNLTNASVSNCITNIPSINDKAKSDAYSELNEKHAMCSIANENPVKIENVKKQQNTINEILTEEMDKSDKVKRDIQNILYRTESKCECQIPTKDHPNEVKNFFDVESQQGVLIEESEKYGKSACVTVAVNTDPLGLLTLFQISAEIVKQVLSYMPRVDYVSYLSRLQAASVPLPSDSYFTCHICGSSFDRPSQLSDHLKEHDLGNPRTCSICRRVVDLKRRQTDLFACQHCGQLFTRAYCRELHQQTCCLGNGKNDVASDLMLLS